MTAALTALESPNGHVETPPAPTTWPLTEDEREIYELLQQADQQIFALHVAPLRQRFQRFLRRVEARLGLQPGELESGRFDLADGQVTRRAEA